MASIGPVDLVANVVVEGLDAGARLRVGQVSAVEAGNTGRVRLANMGDVWLASDADSPLAVGDRVWFLWQQPIGVIGGRLGTPTPDPMPVGALLPYAGTSTALPTGYLLCDGAAVSRTTYATLFDRLGTAYGAGDGSTTFNIPNLTHRFPLGTAPGTGLRDRGITGGAETVTLTTAQIPGHTHGSAGDHTHTVPARADDQVADGTTATVSDNAASGTNTSSTAGAHTHASVGGGGSHENMPPFVTTYYLIKAV